ncbi:hypothetical protein G9A89_012140 [Geosiphon pyriformis]|nr:hypothetical protein G9A89_012140 [Geosiphon pyriformis]
MGEEHNQELVESAKDKLFNGEVDLSKFILLATTSIHETEKLSDPLLSRLDWANADTAQTKKKFFGLIFGAFAFN